jgi:hypothetical protein
MPTRVERLRRPPHPVPLQGDAVAAGTATSPPGERTAANSLSPWGEGWGEGVFITTLRPIASFQLRLSALRSPPSSCPSPRGEKGSLNYSRQPFMGSSLPLERVCVRGSLQTTQPEFISLTATATPERASLPPRSGVWREHWRRFRGIRRSSASNRPWEPDPAAGPATFPSPPSTVPAEDIGTSPVA